MDWSDIKETVATVAPALGTALAGSAGHAVGGMLATALGVEQTPEAVSQAIKADPQAAVKLREVETDLEKARIEAKTSRIQAVNETMRAELESKSPLKSGWRGATGWTFAASCAGIMGSIVWAMFQPEADKAELLSNALVMFGIMATVLGIDINRAGRERLASMGHKPASFMDAIKTRVAEK